MRVRARHSVVSIAQWAEVAGLAEDVTSLSMARDLIARGEGPPVVQIGRRKGVQLHDHAKWVRSKPWAKYLAATALAARGKHHPTRRSK